MDFELADAQRMFQETARQFADKEIVPIAEKVDELGQFPRETIQKLGELGFMGVAVPEAYGGAGPTPSLTWWRWRRSAGPAPPTGSSCR